MKVLYISSEYPEETGFGGIATYTRYMAESMASMGHQVHVICRALHKEIHAVENGVNVHRVYCKPYPLPAGRIWFLWRQLAYKTISQSLNRLSWAATVNDEYLRLSMNTKIDVIEYPDCGAEGYYLSYKKLPLVVRLHTPWTVVRRLNRLKEHPLDCWLQKFMELRAIKHATAITSPSSAMAEMLCKQWQIGAPVVYPNPLPANRFTSNKNGSHWIYTGRLEYRKGVHVLIKSYHMICKTHSPPHLYLIGRAFGTMPDGKSYENHISDLISEFNLNDKIHVIGGVDQSGIHQFLKSSSVAFFPSLWENHPYSCLEAMAASTVVCASDCGGFPEIIQDGSNGILFRCNDPVSLADKMRWLLENANATVNLARKAHQHISDNFNPEKICGRALEVYQNVTKKIAACDHQSD